MTTTMGGSTGKMTTIIIAGTAIHASAKNT
jgi:hypothetical protein